MTHRFTTLAALLAAALLAGPAPAAEPRPAAPESQDAPEAAQQETYEQEDILAEAKDWLGKGAEGLGDLVARAFERYGEPNAFIRGEELAAAVGIGVRYGNGTLVMKAGPTRRVYWQSPSVGFDLGASASKVFALVYDLPEPDALFQRFPGVAGDLYYVGGLGMTFLESDDIEIAPIRLGAGWRQGVSAGYMHFTRKKSWNPL